MRFIGKTIQGCSAGKTSHIIVIAAGVICLVLIFWRFQAAGMEEDFITAMRNGDVHISNSELRDKVWTPEELADVTVIKLSQNAGPQQAIVRNIQPDFGYSISSEIFSYQAEITDSDTSTRHVFGYRRGEPKGWVWVAIHPASLQDRIERLEEEAQ